MIRKILVLVAFFTVAAEPAFAQLDPMLFIKDSQPYILVAVDTSNRMQRDAPTDPASPIATSHYYDPFVYTRSGAGWESSLGVTAANTTTNYRRRYSGLTYVGDGATTTTIKVATDKNLDGAGAATNYSLFEAPTRLALVRAALYQAILMNQKDALFGLLKMRQNTPTIAQGNTTPITNNNTPAQTLVTENGTVTWKMARPKVAGTNGAASSASAVLVAADDDDGNEKVLELLGKDVRGNQKGATDVSGYTPSALVPAGNDTAAAVIDAPIKYMLDDARVVADDLIRNDEDCTNTIVVLITGGGEGTTVVGANPATTASTFLNVRSGRRVPVYVIAIAPPSADVAQLKLIASNSGGQYVEITKTQIDAALAAGNVYPSAIAGTVVVPELVAAINVAVQHGMANDADLNVAPTVDLPFGVSSEFQVTSPVIGSVDLDNAKDITGALLPNTIIYDKAGNVIPQRSNILLATAFSMPSFTASLRAFRQHKPVADSTQASGYKFVSDGTRLWKACVPGYLPPPKQTSLCGGFDSSKRNLYTAKADGTIIPFKTDDPANVAVIANLMNLSVADATALIVAVRNQPLATIVDSTPAIMNEPSLDPPPDASYPGFVAKHKDRRTIIWLGTNNGILEGIDARSGVEVWGFIPTNLLPKLKMSRLGQGMTRFNYMMDGSAKIADVRIATLCDADHASDCWRTHLIIGEGPGGMFYQSFDVTLPGIADMVPPASDNIDLVLQYFSTVDSVKMNWQFPKYSDFDPTLNVFDPGSDLTMQYGDVKASAASVVKSVGQTWSDPAVGQVKSSSGPFTVLVGSGFLPRTTELQANRGNGTALRAGTTFYLLSAADGTLYDSKDVGSDGKNEDVDDCSENELDDHSYRRHGKKRRNFGCNKLKNALQSDPVATGPADSRYVTKAYMGDLDGQVWRFDIILDGSNKPKVNTTTKLWESGDDQPIFSSMATVNVGGTNQYIFFGTGSDLLPSTDVNTRYRLMGVLDKGTTGEKTLDYKLEKTNDRKKDEKVTQFPAVAGDIVFFTTTDFQPASGCKAPVANLFAFTFVGGSAYDSTGDNKVDKKDKPLVKAISGERATAPFIVDQHLVFGTANKVSVFGDSQDYNNGIGQAGVRILSWRQVR